MVTYTDKKKSFSRMYTYPLGYSELSPWNLFNFFLRYYEKAHCAISCPLGYLLCTASCDFHRRKITKCTAWIVFFQADLNLIKQEGHDGPVSLHWLIREIHSYQTLHYLGIGLKHKTPYKD